MGMSASQARFLGLTARKSDNEFEAQQISQQRLNLAGEMDMIATDYAEATSNKILLFNYTDPTSMQTTSTRLDYKTITSTDIVKGLSMRLADRDGRIIIPESFNPDSARTEAWQEREAALSNSCFRLTQEAGETSTTIPLTANVFRGNYFLPDRSNYVDPSNPILDSNGNEVDFTQFLTETEDMTADKFYEYWENGGYTFQNNTLETSEGITRDDYDSAVEGSGYIEDDTAAERIYQEKIADINERERLQYLSIVDENCLDPDYLEERLRSGEWTLQKVDPDTDEWTDASYVNEVPIEDALYTQDDAAASAQYEERSAFFQHQDQAMELRLKQLETEHNAIQTEMDSVKKVIEKNIENSFKTFG